MMDVCAQCRRSGRNLLRCMDCSSVSYCSRRCQYLDWEAHKRECKKLWMHSNAESEVGSVARGSKIASGCSLRRATPSESSVPRVHAASGAGPIVKKQGRRCRRACFRCNKKKLKCNGKFPCGQCIQAGCVGACRPYIPPPRTSQSSSSNSKRRAVKRRLADAINVHRGEQCRRNPQCQRPNKHPGHCRIKKKPKSGSSLARLHGRDPQREPPNPQPPPPSPSPPPSARDDIATT